LPGFSSRQRQEFFSSTSYPNKLWGLLSFFSEQYFGFFLLEQRGHLLPRYVEFYVYTIRNTNIFTTGLKLEWKILKMWK
jgi:hypothetical protein